ncbi:hypothetical protein EVAR_33644_1 [Eumeta japonica]|uniref:Uncharacterized protein n=1 Tax=Eumeta variegata TaxID=151549 RepID=A0A4C1VN22_EUMVA|nr:hypothetical protein EVAR_33644_1 [Eumeta japonica]
MDEMIQLNDCAVAGPMSCRRSLEGRGAADGYPHTGRGIKTLLWIARRSSPVTLLLFIITSMALFNLFPELISFHTYTTHSRESTSSDTTDMSLFTLWALASLAHGDASPCASDCVAPFSLDSMVLFTTVFEVTDEMNQIVAT